ncbi:MAG TPA: DUF488 family protein [Acidimicrobiia bacterium]|nr:DUF488 family protein [Acidimicrobiia bacterium]
MPTAVKVKRLYEPAEPSDGFRVLVDGIWPRGVRREEWPDDTWRPDVAPSRQLRHDYKHQVEMFDEFAERYRRELAANRGLDSLLEIEGTLTLVTATRDVEHSHAAVLADYLRSLI